MVRINKLMGLNCGANINWRVLSTESRALYAPPRTHSVFLSERQTQFRKHHNKMGQRDFYVDDELVINKPGVNTEISPELKRQEAAHGTIAFVEGMSVRTAPVLEQYANRARLFLHDKWSLYGAEFGTQKSAFLNEYHAITDDLSLAVKEPVLPNLIYILTSTLTGSILVNRRALPLRFVTPIVFAAVSTSYFMPRTYDTLSDKLTRFEKEKTPALFLAHQDALNAYHQYEETAKVQAAQARESITAAVHETRLGLIRLLSSDKK